MRSSSVRRYLDQPSRGSGHHVRFHLVDRIDAWERGVSVRARKLTSRSEELWDPSGPEPTMPGPLVLESLLQAGTWLIVLSTDGRRRAALASLGSVEFVDHVRPGDTLDIEAVVESMTDEAALISGRVTVDGRSVLEASEVICTLLDANELDTEEETMRMARLLDRSGDA